MEIDEKKLVARAREGDRQAFEALVRQYQRRVFRVAMGMLRNEDDALEIAQEAFVKAHRNLSNFKGDSAFYTWLHRITSNLCIDLLRRRRGEMVEYDDGVLRDESEEKASELRPSAPPSPNAAAMNRELGEKLNEAMDRLSDAHRRILVLREVEGLSYEEIATVLGIKKGTVMSRLFHARKNMQTMLRTYLSPGELRELTGEEPEIDEAEAPPRGGEKARSLGGGGSSPKEGAG
ncbi:MAG: sigma-70 family RNA polymerase sigma factor [Myxococcota bacterium]